MPRSVGMTGSKWFTCDQCGFDYPIKYRRRQGALFVCTYLPCFNTTITTSDPLGELTEIDNELDVDFEVIEDAL